MNNLPEIDQMRMITCENLQIAASIDSTIQQTHSVYYPSNVLLYVQKGQMSLQLDHQLYSIARGQFALIRKYTHGQCFKTWSKEEGSAKMVAFALQDNFLQTVLERQSFASMPSPSQEQIFELSVHGLLKGLMESIWTYIKENIQLDKSIIELKTLEALLAIGQVRPELLPVLKAYSQAERADLEQFMQHNFQYNIPLEQLARMSGRSLSTFNREFKKLYQSSPHQWIKQQRLELAKRLLLQTDKMPSDVYLEVGFEDLAHFSRSFKHQFGKNPSQIKRLVN
ncbi:MAG: helix-turn-helix domain-containing protein [Aureispira sp.]